MIDLKAVRFAVEIDGTSTDLDVDELQDRAEDFPGGACSDTFARFVLAPCVGSEEQIARVALAQAYHDQDGGLVRAAQAVRAVVATSDGPISAPLFLRLTTGDEEAVRDALYRISANLHDHPDACDERDMVARARLYAFCEANGIDTGGNEDPGAMRLKRRA